MNIISWLDILADIICVVSCIYKIVRVLHNKPKKK